MNLEQNVPAAPVPPAAPAAPQATLPPTPAPVPPAAPELDDDEETPPAAPTRTLGRGGEAMSEDAISKRVARERRKWLRETYGTDDEAKIEEIKRRNAELSQAAQTRDAELARLKEAEAERERANMSEVDRLKADLDAANAKNAKLEADIAAMRNDVFAEKQKTLVLSTANELQILPSWHDLLVLQLGNHIRSLGPIQKKAFNPAALRRWIRDWSKKNPDSVRKPAAAAPPPAPEAAPAPKPAPTPVRRPLGGASPAPARPAPKPVNPGQRIPGQNREGKTVAPGPNQMNRKEYAAYKKEMGMA